MKDLYTKKKLDKRTDFKIHNFVRKADSKKTFSKGETTNWSNKIYEITEFFNDRIPSYRIELIKETYNEALLKKTKLTMKENKVVRKITNLNPWEIKALLNFKLNQTASVHDYSHLLIYFWILERIHIYHKIQLYQLYILIYLVEHL